MAFGEVKGQLAGRVTHVRAHDPVRALAELDGLLLGHWVVRWVIVRAARAAGVPPVAISFVGAVRVLRVRVAGPVGRGGRAGWWRDVLREIGRERLRPRRDRQCPRARKTTRSHWPTKKPTDHAGTLPVLRVVPATES